MNETSKSRQEWFRSFLWTCVFCFAIAVLLYVLEISRPFWLSASIAFCIGWCIFTAQLVLRSRLEHRIGLLAASILATGLGLAVAIGIIGVFIDQSGFNFGGFELRSASLALFFGVLGTIIFSNMHRVYEMQQALSDAELAQLRTERRLSEAQLKTLQAQIEPHFLFNTLSTVKGLIRTDPDGAEETLQQLTALLRKSLSRSRETGTTLGQEIELVQAYLRIQQIRMGERLQFDIICPEELEPVALPPLLVQPLVENALTHGIEPAESGGALSILVASDDSNGLRITISDTGLGLKESAPTAGHGTGLANVRERLSSLYGDLATLTLAPNSPTGVVASLSIPLTDRHQ